MPPVLLALFAIAAVVLLALESFHIGTPRWSPGWLGLAFAALVVLSPVLAGIDG